MAKKKNPHWGSTLDCAAASVSAAAPRSARPLLMDDAAGQGVLGRRKEQSCRLRKAPAIAPHYCPCFLSILPLTTAMVAAAEGDQ
jgi:hypothetical protein